MADTKGSALPAMTTPVGTDIFVVVDDPGGTPATQKVTFANAWTNYFRGQADGRYLEVAGSGEISIITAKTTPADGDFLLIEDSAAANIKKSLTVLNLWDNSHKAKADALYFAKATAAEISALTEKAAPVGADHVLIEDSAAGNAKKRTTITNLLTGSGVAGELSTKFSTDTKTTPVGADDYIMAVDPDNGTAALKEHGVTWDNSWDNFYRAKQDVCFIIAASDETTALTTGTAKATFRVPHAVTLTEVRASVTTAPTGSVLTVDINDGGTSIMTTNKITIDATEKTSETAATAPVLTDTALADDAEITIDIDTVGSTVAGAGLKVTLIGTRT